MRPILYYLHGLQVAIVNMTAMNKTRFTIVHCLQGKTLETEKVLGILSSVPQVS